MAPSGAKPCERMLAMPASRKPRSGRKTIAPYTALSLHQVDVFDRDRAPVAIIRHQDGESDRRLGGRDRQHDESEDLPNDIAKAGREGYEIDVDGEQDQLDRH